MPSGERYPSPVWKSLLQIEAMPLAPSSDLSLFMVLSGASSHCHSTEMPSLTEQLLKRNVQVVVVHPGKVIQAATPRSRNCVFLGFIKMDLASGQDLFRGRLGELRLCI